MRSCFAFYKMATTFFMFNMNEKALFIEMDYFKISKFPLEVFWFTLTEQTFHWMMVNPGRIPSEE